MVERRARTRHESARVVAAQKAVGQRVRAIRKSLGLTLERASERADLDLRHLQKIEAGTVTATLATLVRIADGLSIPVADLLAAVRARRGTRTNASAEEIRPNPTRASPKSPRAVRGAIGSSRDRAAARVSAFRHERGLSQGDLATRASMPQQHLQRIEAGKQNITLATLDRLAEALGVDPAELLVRRGRLSTHRVR